MKEYKYILFDLDGTITDPGEGITNSVIYALNKFGIFDKKENLYKFIGPPLAQSFQKYYGFDEEKARLGIEYYREYYTVYGMFENIVYDGIEEMLKNIKESGKKILMATSKPEKFAKQILEYFKLDKYFDYVAGATMDEKRVRKAEVISYALSNYQIQSLEEVLMVGDRKHDVLGAKEVGIDCVGVLYGYGDREELEKAGADYIVETVEELAAFLQYI
ncbi:MAG: HAD family hydrolase [Lachnospiraceae bacterium]